MTNGEVKEMEGGLSGEEIKEAFAQLDAVAVYIEETGGIRLWNPNYLVSRCAAAHGGDLMKYKMCAVSPDKYIPVLEKTGHVRFLLIEPEMAEDYRKKVKDMKERGAWGSLVKEMEPGGGRGPDGILEADRVETIARIDQGIRPRGWGGKRQSLGEKVRTGVKRAIEDLKQRPSF